MIFLTLFARFFWICAWVQAFRIGWKWSFGFLCKIYTSLSLNMSFWGPKSTRLNFPVKHYIVFFWCSPFCLWFFSVKEEKTNCIRDFWIVFVQGRIKWMGNKVFVLVEGNIFFCLSITFLYVPVMKIRKSRLRIFLLFFKRLST